MTVAIQGAWREGGARVGASPPQRSASGNAGAQAAGFRSAEAKDDGDLVRGRPRLQKGLMNG